MKTTNQSLDNNNTNEGLLPTRQRASSTPNAIQGSARTQARDAIIDELFAGKLTQGEALKKLRVQVLDIKQDKFAQMVKVSRKTLSDVENDKGNYSVETINQIFRPFGLRMGLVKL